MASQPQGSEPDLEHQLVAEIDAMAEYALAEGMPVPPKLVRAVLAIQKADGLQDAAGQTALAGAHDELRRMVAPATPRTLLVLRREANRKRRIGWLPSFGPVRVVRQLMVVGIAFLIALITLGLSPDVSRDSGGILENSGTDLLLNLLFVLSAAGLGAVFASLFKVGRFVSNGTYDPKFESTYWINIVLGLIAGLVLAELIPEVLQTDTSTSDFNFARPVLALLGGFSAAAVWRILRKLVDAVESVFRGNADEIVKAQVESARSRLALQQTEDRIKMSTKLVQLQQTVGDGAGTADVQAAIQGLLDEVLPYDGTTPPPPQQSAPSAPEPAPSGTPAPAPSGAPEPPQPTPTAPPDTASG